MTAWLPTQGYPGDRKRVSRLLHLMGLETIYPKPHLSIPGMVEQRYPYLLRGGSSERCNQVWSCDSTYIRLQRGFVSSFRGDGLLQSVCALMGNLCAPRYEFLP